MFVLVHTVPVGDAYELEGALHHSYPLLVDPLTQQVCDVPVYPQCSAPRQNPALGRGRRIQEALLEPATNT